MGKRHREDRKVQKKLAKVIALHPRFKQTELGELRQEVSKAEARRRFIHKHAFLLGMMMSPEEREMVMLQLFDEISKRATADLQAEEDARCLKYLEEAAAVATL